MKGFGVAQTTKNEPLAFSKMAGAGNDFVVIDNRAARVADASELTRRICTRRLSVGADGLILIEASARATFRTSPPRTRTTSRRFEHWRPARSRGFSLQRTPRQWTKRNALRAIATAFHAGPRDRRWAL